MSAELAGIALDGLFRGNVAARPEAIAIADPPDRATFTDGAARRLSFAAADAEVERLASLLRSFGSPPGSAVAVQLPNVVESALTLLAILRAGMLAVPVPLAWRRSDLVAALAPLEPKTIVAVARFLDERPAEMVCEAAAELFSLSFPCAFGDDLPDGMIPLSSADTSAQPAPFTGLPSSGGATIATFDARRDGYFAARRSDAQWLAAGLTTLLESHIEAGDTIVSATPLHSLAGIAGAFVPWLLSGGTLQLLQGASPPIPESGTKTHLVAPAAAIRTFTAQRQNPFTSRVAVHRSARTLSLDFSGCASRRIVDLFAIGEFGVLASAREDPRRAMPLTLGPVAALAGSAGAPVVLETHIRDGEICLRGPMLPDIRPTDDGFVATGWRGKSDGNGGLVVLGAPERVATVGGLRFGLDDLQSRLAQAVPGLTVFAVEDSLLGERLHLEVANAAAAAAALEAAGHTRLVVEAAARGREARRAVR